MECLVCDKVLIEVATCMCTTYNSLHNLFRGFSPTCNNALKMNVCYGMMREKSANRVREGDDSNEINLRKPREGKCKRMNYFSYKNLGVVLSGNGLLFPCNSITNYGS